MKLALSTLMLFACLVIFGCRKSDTPKPETHLVDLKKAVEITQEIYLWANQLPANMKDQPFTSYEEIMDYAKNHSYEDSLKRNVDRWSFAIPKNEWDNISQGIAGDFGLGLFFYPQTNDLRVKSVEKASPAGLAGIARGWQVTAIQGVSVIDTLPANIKSIQNAIFGNTTATVTFKKPDGSSQTIVLKTATYREQPVYLDTVYQLTTGPTGYLVYNSFLGDSALVVQNMDRVFKKFTEAQISNMIVDLRYNSGGYVWMEELLANYLINNAGDKQIMAYQEYNEAYGPKFNWASSFMKKGSLNLNKIYIITSKGTASASELLINGLRPFMNVITVGTRTTGKAVGYFPIEVENNTWYIFPVSFRSINALKQGNYFDGFQPTLPAIDGLDKNWGDIQESCLAAALGHINPSPARRSLQLQAPVSISGSKDLLANPNDFSGAIETRRHLPN